MAYDPQLTSGGSPYLGKLGTFPQFHEGIAWMASEHDKLHNALRTDFRAADTALKNTIATDYKAADSTLKTSLTSTITSGDATTLKAAKDYADEKIPGESGNVFNGAMTANTIAPHPTLAGVATDTTVITDTGWRRLDPASGVTGNIFMRRKGNDVHFMFHALVTTTAGTVTIVSVPVGFRPLAITGANWRNGLVIDDAGTSPRQVSYYNGSLRILSMETGKQYGGYATFITGEAMPTAFPGTPV